MIKILDAQFVTTATKIEMCPFGDFPELAFVGRSNVGKSSMVNALCQRKKLVRVSNTPGRTRALNFFDLSVEYKSAKRVIRLCDLPGYGFAKVSKTERISWKSMIEGYLQNRKNLRVVVSIIDAEVGPSEEDAQMIDFLETTPPKIIVVATKIDRVNKAARKPKLDQYAKELDIPREAIFGFSSIEGLGREELLRHLVSQCEKVK
jgi:GTP-binding protein